MSAKLSGYSEVRSFSIHTDVRDYYTLASASLSPPPTVSEFLRGCLTLAAFAPLPPVRAVGRGESSLRWSCRVPEKTAYILEVLASRFLFGASGRKNYAAAMSWATGLMASDVVENYFLIGPQARADLEALAYDRMRGHAEA